MNIWDILILLAVLAAVLSGVKRVRKRRRGGCGCGCEGCTRSCPKR